MRLWKVKTQVELTIESINIFGKKKRYNCYFTWNQKYIYARDADEAKMKYGDYFFSPAEDGYNKLTLYYMDMCYITKSSNMKFNLSFNERIVHTHETIVVVDSEVTAPIDIIKHNSTANDFRDWFINGDAKNYSIDELNWMDK